MNPRQSRDDAPAPRLSAWEDSLGRIVVGEANTTGAWIAADAAAVVDLEDL